MTDWTNSASTTAATWTASSSATSWSWQQLSSVSSGGGDVVGFTLRVDDQHPFQVLDHAPVYLLQ